MKISVTEPLSQSWEWTKHVLFDKFDIRKWLILGFFAFLAGLGQFGGYFKLGGHFGRDEGCGHFPHRHDSLEEVGEWILEYLPISLLVIGTIVMVSIILWTLFNWLSSRGKFMFLDGVVRNKTNIVESWNRFSSLGNNLFLFRMCIDLLAGGMMIGLFILFTLIAWPSLSAGQFGITLLTAYIPGIGLGIAVMLVFFLIHYIIEDFIVPIMYKRNVKFIEAVRIFKKNILPGQGIAFILFYLVRISISFTAIVIVIFGVCLTCCVAGLPYISSVVFLPIFVFVRGYSVYFLGQFGDEWKMIATETTV
ncbi:MAG: hypothetical protein B6244_00290 [Candidatus Cloacimonetes bacterium 4572_55]|nr:MAG: hypothetical protein B6244_00290 [Candidatus Cloacimonetes bacterium 4572_55]